MAYLTLKPEYLYRPEQIALRALRTFSRSPRTVTLPWGHKLRVDPRDSIGRAILNAGVYDLPVTEALWRLTDPGDTALDVGANIGYTASVLSMRGAIVHAFEPHPQVFSELEANTRALSGVTAHRLALSDKDGESQLLLPEGFEGNYGLARISDEGDITVECRRLDSLGFGRVQVLKLDVEGHELPALCGAGDLSIRDIVFEDHHEESSPVFELLRSRGYDIFWLASTTFGPVISPDPVPRLPWEPPNFLATTDATRALYHFKPGGWHCLRRRQAARLW